MFYCDILEHECPEGVHTDCQECPLVKGPNNNQIIKVMEKKFQLFSIHEYMDEQPWEEVMICTKEEAIEHARHMTETYSGGPTTYVKELTAEEAMKYILGQYEYALNHPAEDETELEKYQNVIDSLMQDYWNCYKK